MSEFKGTPGPWRYRSDQTGCVWAAEDVLASVYPNCPEHEINNVMGEWTRIHEMRANARLIAAAPDLLAALQGAIGALEFSQDFHRDLGNEEQAFAADKLDAARAAIARALGSEAGR